MKTTITTHNHQLPLEKANNEKELDRESVIMSLNSVRQVLVDSVQHGVSKQLANNEART